MQTQKVYFIFWAPSGYSFPAGYVSGTQQYAQDVAADAGKTSNAYGAIQQYGVSNVFAYGGSFVDSNSFPSSDCPTGGGTICITDQDLVTEIAHVQFANGWSGGLVNQFALVLPPNVDTCTDANPADGCSYNAFCAYHWWYHYGGSSTPYVYLVLPYEVPSASACHTSDGSTVEPEPNGDVDVLLSPLTHEEREAATDPLGTAWYDSSPEAWEADDKCYITWGAQIGQTGGSVDYNQLINGDAYETQNEWSNKLMGCYQVGPPTVTALSATSGLAGTPIGISGTNFFAANGSTPTVTFNGTPAAAVAVDSPTHLTVTVPAGVHTGKVTVQALGGTATSTQSFGPRPVISSLTDTLDNPDTDDVTGTTIFVHGTGFFGVTSVKFNGVAASFSSVATDGTSLHAIVPASATTGPVTVTTSAGGTSAGSTFTVKPKITSFTPTSAKGLTNVTITGTGLAGTTAVHFNGDASPHIGTNTATSVVAQVPDDATPGPITVGNGTDTSAPSALSFKPLPFIASFTPTDGVAGTTSVAITGGELADVSGVKFGTLTAAFVPVSATEVDATVPIGFSSGTIAVVTPEGTAVSTQTFSVTKVTSITPTSAAAGATLTITGQGLASATTVDFQGHAAVPVSGTPTATTVKVVVPNDATTGVLTVNTPRATGTTPIFKPLPKITTLSIVDGGGGDTVHVTGTNLLGPPTVKFGTYAALSVSNVTATGLDTQVPNAPFSSGAVSITTPGGTAGSTQIFQVTKVTGITPAQAVAGTTLTITGQGLGDAQTVDFPNHTGVVPTSATATSIKVVVPGDAIAGQLTVHMPDLMTPLTPLFKPLPKITSLSVVDGVPGDAVHVTGTNLLGASAVKFGTVSAGAPTGVSATGFDTTVPNTFLTSGTVSVTTPAGTATSTQIFQITKVTGLTPTLAAAGATLTITGQGLGDAQTVDFIGHTGVVPTSTTATSVKVVVPDDARIGPLTVNMPDGDAPTTATFKPLPKIAGFTVNPVQAGDLVTITGTNLEPDGNPPSLIKIGTVTMPLGAINTQTSVTAIVPDTAVTGLVTITTADGTATSPTTLKIRPTISADPSPNEGKTGAAVTLTGKTFKGTTSVKFGSAAAAFTVASDGLSLTVTVPAAATSGPIAVTNAGGTTSSSDFTVDPAITSFTPTSAAVGATVTITGTGLAGATAVDFNAAGGTVSATPISSTPTSIKVAVPNGATNGNLTVHTASPATATSAGSLTLTLTLASFSPLGGAAGTSVTITGAGFSTATVTDVKFNGTSVGGVGHFTVVSPTQITTTVPSGATSGTITVVRNTAPLALLSATSFKILSISALVPAGAHAGDDLEIDGTNLGNSTLVTFAGGVTAAPTSSTATAVHVTVPGGAQTGTIKVTTSNFGDVTSTDSFTMLAPSVDSFNASNSSTGTTVTITGAGFVGVTDVSFSGTPSIDYTVNSNTSITATVPAGAATGKISVTTPDGTGQSASSLVAHSNGVGQTYYETDPVDTYSATDAVDAAKVWANGTLDIGVTCSGEAAVAMVTGSQAAVWVYGSGALQGHVFVNSTTTAMCPVDTDPAWH